MSKLTFDYGKHQYSLDGRVIPGVSEILQGAGLSDPRWFKPEHAERGHAIHSLIEQYNNEDPVPPSEYQGYVNSWMEFESDWQILVDSAERKIYHELYNYAGTIDALGEDEDGEVIVIDVKTGVPMPWHQLQLCAYGMMVKAHKNGNRVNPRIVCVYLKEDGYKAVEYDYRDKEVFLSALRIWKWINWS